MSWFFVLWAGCVVDGSVKGDSGYFLSSHCAAVASWAKQCGLDPADQDAEVDRCVTQHAELLDSCGEAQAASWADAVSSLYECYTDNAVCPDGLEDTATQQQAAVCGDAFDADVEPVLAVCSDDVEDPEGSLFATCVNAESIHPHQTPTVHDNVLYLGEEDLQAISLPFPLSWYGEAVDTVYVSSNGLLLFEESNNTGCCEGLPLPRADSLNGLIALAWTDLDPSMNGATVSWGVTGEEGERVLTVSFVNVPTYTGKGMVSSAAAIHEVDGHVDVHIGVIQSPDVAVTVGMESMDGTQASCVDGLVNTTGTWRSLSYRLHAEGAQ